MKGGRERKERKGGSSRRESVCVSTPAWNGWEELETLKGAFQKGPRVAGLRCCCCEAEAKASPARQG